MSAPEQLKHLGDAASLGTVLATLAGLLPAIAAVFTIVWTAIRILETETVQRLLGHRRRRKDDE